MEEDIDALRWVEPKEISPMKEKKIKVIIESKYRIIADLQGVFITGYFFVLTYFIPFNRDLFGIPITFFKSIFLPIILSLPWLLIYYLGLNRWAKTFKIIDSIMMRVGNYYRVFYLVNVLIIFLFFIFPILTPILSLIALFYLLFKIISYPKKRIAKFISLIMLLSLYVLFIVLFYEDFMFIYFNFMIENTFPVLLQIWENNLYSIYIFSLILASSSSLSSFIRFIYEGAMQVDSTIKIPYRGIQLVQASYIVIFSFLQFYLQVQTVIFLLIVTSLSIVEGLIRWFKKLGPQEQLVEGASRWISWIIYIMFILAESLRRILSYSPILQILPIGLGALYFLVLLIYAFIKAK